MIARPGGEPTSDAASSEPSLAAIARDLAFRLEVIRQLGWIVPLGKGAPLSERAEDAAGGTAADPVRDSERDADLDADLDAELDRRRELLDVIAREVAGCVACPLCESRTRTVFGVGDPSARLMFIGEAPGFDEDRLGEPFVGKAGQLLDRMIAAMGLRREQVYIANVVKCRPPQNRAPEAREAVACLPYLRRQIDIVRPEVICLLGNTPLRAVLGSSEGITRARGRVIEWQDTPVVPTFHPAYLLRNTADKRLAWEDLQTVMRLLGLEVPGPG